MVQNCLIIGPGIHRRDGWMTLDADPANKPDFLGTIPPFPSDLKAIRWDEIEWIHGVTSLHPWEAKEALTEIYEMLAPGGRLTLEQPDFDKAKHRPEWLFGDPAFKNPLHMNRWSWRPDALKELLSLCGFSKMAVLAAKHHFPERDFRIEAYR